MRGRNHNIDINYGNVKKVNHQKKKVTRTNLVTFNFQINKAKYFFLY